MSPRLLGEIIDCAIPFLGGVYAVLLGSRKVGKPPGQDVGYDAWIDRHGGFLRTLGPLLVVWASARFLYSVFARL